MVYWLESLSSSSPYSTYLFFVCSLILTTLFEKLNIDKISGLGELNLELSKLHGVREQELAGVGLPRIDTTVKITGAEGSGFGDVGTSRIEKIDGIDKITEG